MYQPVAYYIPGSGYTYISRKNIVGYFLVNHTRSSIIYRKYIDSGFLVEAALKMLGEGGLSRCLTDEMRAVLILGGFSCVKSAWHVVLARFFVFCLCFIFCD